MINAIGKREFNVELPLNIIRYNKYFDVWNEETVIGPFCQIDGKDENGNCIFLERCQGLYIDGRRCVYFNEDCKFDAFGVRCCDKCNSFFNLEDNYEN